MTNQCEGRVATASASRYLQQLCKHWSRRFAVEFDAATGRVPFDNGAVLELTAHDDSLALVLSVPTDGNDDRMRGVVEEHLNRFAFREAPLPFEWQEWKVNGHD
ncbi:DUF2218 domain-containing protein [Sphingomonas sp. 37zxx]|uniref:DUF2218 domain-containing protein n=1 Tax=Sphingomonas sp. 37zxx TaxID=1550073 RepID=UPI00053BDC8E|nr:DUF2218 domain-containing protein [Sphingomonas sp. 37zxx]